MLNENRKSVLTKWGASVDWKCSSTPMTDICSSHLRLVSLQCSWYSPALLNRDRNAASSCSASVHRAPVAAWQKITSRRSCRDVSVVGKICLDIRDSRGISGGIWKKKGAGEKGEFAEWVSTSHLHHYTCPGAAPALILYPISLNPLRG